MLRRNISYRPDQVSKMRDIRKWTGENISQQFRQFIDSLHARLSKTNTKNQPK